MIYRLPDNERAAIYTMGRLSAVKGPGFVFVIPVLQTMTRIDVGSATLDLASAKVTYHVTDAGKALQVVRQHADNLPS